MHLASLDLNLLVALRALLEERNVTRAGQRIGLSQPAMSGALARLRHHFDDDLLARTGNSYELTALGRALMDRTVAACDLAERVFDSQSAFDPAKESREFRIIASDYAVTVFGARLVRAVQAEAPGVRLHFELTPATVVEETAALLSTTDGLFLPHGIISGYPAVEVFRDRWVFVVSEDHPEVGDELTLDDLRRLPWVMYQRLYASPSTRQLGMLGIEPRSEVSADTFHALCFLVSGTRNIALVQARLAERLRAAAGVRVLEPPYGTVPLHEALWWHPLHTHDAAHTWFRETVARVAERMTGQAAEG
ncbi:LysR family transcriptional regulator [Streptomyces fuscichromogenes]|uniref:LysR family transcriptional regulator n=1 Tax=Streptomyces fuscichromogenes TaxID=1324013 RepID=UPI0038283856